MHELRLFSRQFSSIRGWPARDGEADWHEGRHIRLCRALARETGWPVILLVGVPSYRAYHRFTPDLAGNAFQAVFFRDYEPKIEVAGEYWWQYITVDEQTGRA